MVQLRIVSDVKQQCRGFLAASNVSLCPTVPTKHCSIIILAESAEYALTIWEE